MFRITLLWMVVVFIAAYAWKDWYKSLCGLILMMAFIEHPDFPKTLMGIQGLNPWNILLAFILLAWVTTRKRENLKWDMPRYLNILLAVYFLTIVMSFLRIIGDVDELSRYALMTGGEPSSMFGLFSELVVNCVKWVIPAALLYDGCNSTKRFRIALASILTVYILLAIQVIRWMPLEAITGGGDLAARSIKILLNEVGYHRVNMSMLLAGASWALLSVRVLLKKRSRILLNYLAVVAVIFAQALTGGRMGYATWIVLGGIFGVVKWRKVAIFGPLALLLILAVVPAVKERMLQGFSGDVDTSSALVDEYSSRDENSPDYYTVTAGRTFAWSFVIDEIASAPFFGYGREAMIRTGLTAELQSTYGEAFPHPHNAYLQLILDNGLLGVIPIFIFYVIVIKFSLILFREGQSAICMSIGGVSLSLVLALLIAAFGSQTFYPREGAIGMWSAIFLLFRVHTQYERWIGQSNEPERIDDQPEFWSRLA